MLVITSLPRTALAQDSDDPPPASITQVDFGFDGTMAADRWSPIRVWITSPGLFEGVLTLEYDQDATQAARIAIPVTTTPGAVVPFELSACPPANIDSFTLTLANRQWRERRVYERFASRGFTLPVIEGSNRRVVVIGSSSAAGLVNPLGVTDFEVNADDDAPPPPPSSVNVPGQGPPPELWSVTSVAGIKPASMPLAWLSWESADVVIASADALADADPRAREALMTWVEWGGRLILEVDAAGNRWVDAVGPDRVSAAPVRPGVVGAEARAAARVKPTGARRETPDPGPGAPVPARLFTITKGGEREGWTTAWPPEGSPPESRTGMIARGPVGMGMVMLVGVDPKRISPIADDAATQIAWRHLVSNDALSMLPEHAKKTYNENFWWYTNTGWGPTTTTAVRAAIDRIATVPPVGGGVFVVIALAMLGLALLVGPIDWFVLRRRGLSKWSWATALCWTTLAGGIAIGAPALVRSGGSIASSITCVDVIQAEDNRSDYEWRSGIVGVWAGAPIEVATQEAPGAWWRGISPLNFHGQAGKTFGHVVTRIRGSGRESAAALSPLRQGQWTFRTLMSQRPGAPGTGTSPRVSLARDGSGIDVTLSGLPAGATPSEVIVITAEGARIGTLTPSQDAGGRPQFVARCEGSSLPSLPASWFFESRMTDYGPEPQQAFVPGAATQLPGSRARTDAITSRVRSGAWACVMFMLDGAPPDDGLVVDPTTARNGLRVYRVLVPLSEEPR